MKVALYIEDGTEQIVLTPESAVERMVLKKIEDSGRKMNTYWGQFYDCHGGWVRESGCFDEKNSLIIRFEEKDPTQ